MEYAGRSADVAIVALHDCDHDPNRAINMLLEGEDDQASLKHFEDYRPILLTSWKKLKFLWFTGSVYCAE